MAEQAIVLLVDDEAVLRSLVRPYLEAEGIAVIEARNGPEAIQLLRSTPIDLVVLDVMLPGEDGFSVLRKAREFTDIPIIMLTARRDEAYRVSGLRQGADDYVIKPFSMPELMARVDANLRRAQDDRTSDVLELGELSVDVTARTVQVSGEAIELTRREFDLLVSLLENLGRVLTREALLRQVWGTEFVTPKTVDVHIAMLRRKVGEVLDIKAIRGVGYRLERPS